MYLNIPNDIETDQGSNKSHVLKLLNNVYLQKQSGRVWNDYLTGKLLKLGFRYSIIDEFVFTVTVWYFWFMLTTVYLSPLTDQTSTTPLRTSDART